MFRLIHPDRPVITKNTDQIRIKGLAASEAFTQNSLRSAQQEEETGLHVCHLLKHCHH